MSIIHVDKPRVSTADAPWSKKHRSEPDVAFDATKVYLDAIAIVLLCIEFSPTGLLENKDPPCFTRISLLCLSIFLTRSISNYFLKFYREACPRPVRCAVACLLLRLVMNVAPLQHVLDSAQHYVTHMF